MIVQALVSFGAMVGGQMVSVKAGELLALPPGADWLTAGLVAVVDAPPDASALETTEALPPPDTEHAVTRKRRK